MWNTVCSCGLHGEWDRFEDARVIGEAHVRLTGCRGCVVFRVGEAGYYLMHPWGTSRHVIRPVMWRRLAQLLAA